MVYMRKGSVADESNPGKTTGSMDRGSEAKGKKKRRMGFSDEKAEEKTTAGNSKKTMGYKGHGLGY